MKDTIALATIASGADSVVRFVSVLPRAGASRNDSPQGEKDETVSVRRIADAVLVV
jgi:hypothetical protein